MNLRTTWDLTELFTGDDDPAIDKALAATTEAVESFAKTWEDRTDYLQAVKPLEEALLEYEELMRTHGECGKTLYYFWLRNQVDQSNSVVKARYGQLLDEAARLATRVQFFELNLGGIEKSRQKTFLQAPELEGFRYFLQEIFDHAQYQLSQDKEEIFTLLHKTSQELWVEMVSDLLAEETALVTDEDGEKRKQSFESLMSLMSHRNKQLRDEAAAAVHDINRRHAPVAAHELNALLSHKKTEDGLRGFERPDSARHLSDGLNTGTVDTLLEVVESQDEIAHRFYRLKARLLGVERLAYHERNVDYGSMDASYSYQQAVEIVGRVLEGLDPQFAALFEQFLNRGRIDVYPSAGKRGGAFCVHWTHDLPTYICLNFTGKLRDVTTLAHEVGHGIHNELMRERQSPLYFDASLATAEVASQYLEDFVLDELAREADESTMLAIDMMRLNDDISAIFRQAACYRFEQELHETFRASGHVSREQIGQLFTKHMQSYMGDAVEQSPGSENWWVYWSHIRMHFYVYSYVSGLLIAKSMQRQTRQDKAYIHKVKEFLAAGSSRNTEAIFSDLGIDLSDRTFWQTGVDAIASQLDEAERRARSLE